MKQHEFLANVRDRGSYSDQVEAERVSRIVLGLLGERLAGNEAQHVAAQLPEGLQDAVTAHAEKQVSYGAEEFLRRVAAELDTTEETAKWDASAVLTTVGEAVTGGQLNQVLTQLPPAYAVLFGKPDLA